ncbi:heavy metal-associated domain-containing protein [Devosia sp.]|uniref:heavy-metal-associated domain-containing protein n=1 Tax=Devosia sp. TaxID=1871048 RepID=UPI002AFEBE71|nr:heavy metal-associated domain-containing protein [Devosia sp.]
MTRTVLRSDEFSCPSCVAKIEKALAATPGVISAKVHFNTGRIEIEHDLASAPVEILVSAVKSTGYEARPAAF